MVPEENVIDASSLYKFRKFRLKDMDLLINKTVILAIIERHYKIHVCNC
ncbi:hypothetical protein [Bacteroides ovatus]|jgi:hypothetical protein